MRKPEPKMPDDIAALIDELTAACEQALFCLTNWNAAPETTKRIIISALSRAKAHQEGRR